MTDRPLLLGQRADTRQLRPRPAQDRANAILWAREVVADPLAVIVDTETTSLDMETVEICDLSIVAINGRVLLDTLVRPLKPIPMAATVIHGISDADVSEAPRWSEIVHDVAMLLQDCRTVAWNAAFDSEVIARLCRGLGVAPFTDGWQCAMKAFGQFDGTPNKWRKGYKWWKLGEAADRCGVSAGGFHRALADAETTRKIVLEMANFAADYAP